MTIDKQAVKDALNVIEGGIYTIETHMGYITEVHLRLAQLNTIKACLEAQLQIEEGMQFMEDNKESMEEMHDQAR